MKNIIENAFVEILSGIAEYHKDGGVITQDEYGREITIFFPTKTPRYAVVKRYWSNGNKWWEEEYQNGELHGKSLGWWENGNKRWEYEYQNGELHGKSLGWYINGSKRWEEEYQNGELHGKSFGWYENGNKLWEREYQNGKPINEKYY